MKLTLYNGIILFLLLLMISCQKDNAEELLPGVLSIEGDKIIFVGDETKPYSFAHLSGAPIEWSVSSAPDWLKITPTQGYLSSDGTILKLTSNVDSISPGKENGVIEIVGNQDQRYTIDVSVCISLYQ